MTYGRLEKELQLICWTASSLKDCPEILFSQKRLGFHKVREENKYKVMLGIDSFVDRLKAFYCNKRKND